MKKTFECLAKAFVGESMARNRYTIYAKAAMKEGFEQIAGIFIETAEQERVHAKKLFEAIQAIKQKDHGTGPQKSGERHAEDIDATQPEKNAQRDTDRRAARDPERVRFDQGIPEHSLQDHAREAQRTANGKA